MLAGGGWAAMFPDEVWENIFSFLIADGDYNMISLIYRGWYSIEHRSRCRIFIGNCYAVIPATTIHHFPNVRVISIKGKPHFADFNLVPSDWGARTDAWVATMAEGWPHLEELHLKCMVISMTASSSLPGPSRTLGFSCSPSTRASAPPASLPSRPIADYDHSTSINGAIILCI